MREIVKTSKSQIRREKILSLLNESEAISTTELAEYFNVSNYTIRRDLNALADQRKLRRHHGGAKNSGAPSKTGRRNDCNQRLIARQVLPAIFQGCNIYIDSPYLAETLVSILPDHDLRILTNNPRVHHLIANKANIRMYFLGGSFGLRDDSFHYPDFIYRGEFESIDIAIVEVDCIDSDGFALSECMNKAVRQRLALSKAKKSNIILHPQINKQSKAYPFKVCSMVNIEHVIEVIQ
ncbi:DeoR/GlpR family DNA-binding transcription regulator (plasmid) [Photobacterium sp. DA100]|uniref:DeoR family transcriptional regulator n=1 Tax=Photobacterium sp. DA100 TaxID=3027472 RepID=UPI0024787BC8|nr:DeoR/GlpR family DNA-binding transcription regulator [Photobacterium sp. DA100]WEM44841.1 DeoR/GlpR family DNA-binding transcription regulator [Photobacterium sp. DA100]